MTDFQWCEVLAIILFTLYFGITNQKDSVWYILIDSLASICGVFCVVLCAGGKRSQYYWGFVNILAYCIIAFFNRFYGEVMLNALYYLPCQFIGLYNWKTHYNAEEEHVKCEKMPAMHIAILTGCTMLCVWGYKLLLDSLRGNSTFLDSTSTVFSIVANALMVLRYREQWVLWIIVDAVTVVMWFLAADYLLTAMWAIFLCNAIYGFITWTKASGKANQRD